MPFRVTAVEVETSLGNRTIQSGYVPMLIPADPFIVVVGRLDVERGRTAETVGVLRHWVTSSSNPSDVQGKLRLCFEGYDADDRELWTIPEVRRFMSSLDQEFPYWFVFADLSSEFLKVVAFCLCRVSSPRPGATSIHPEDLASFFERHFGAMNQLLDHWSLSQHENEELSNRVIRYFEAAKILN